MNNALLVNQIVEFLSEYPPEYIIALCVGFSFILSFLWLSAGYMVYSLFSLGGDDEC